jgi:hypothetical protein
MHLGEDLIIITFQIDDQGSTWLDRLWAWNKTSLLQVVR